MTRHFDVTQAEAEHVVEPHSMAHALGQGAMAVVRVGWRLHATTLALPRSDRQPRYRDNASARVSRFPKPGRPKTTILSREADGRSQPHPVIGCRSNNPGNSHSQTPVSARMVAQPE
jgi:hypothetical protein